jgi:hypothetical protein
VPVKIAGCRHFSPGNRGMPGLQFIRQAPRGLGNNLKAPDDGIKGLKIVAQALVTVAVRELFGQVDGAGAYRGARRFLFQKA